MPPPPARPALHPALGLAAFVLGCLAVSALGGIITARSVGTWYQALAKPAFNPPDGVFAPVWTILYLMIALAGWQVWRRYGWRAARSAFHLYVAQLALNLGWTVLFFGLRQIGAAFAEILLLWLLILANLIAFWRLDRIAGLLLLPYLLWVGFAALLTFEILRLN